MDMEKPKYLEKKQEELLPGKILSKLWNQVSLSLERFLIELKVVLLSKLMSSEPFFLGSLVDTRPLKEAPNLENTIQDFKVIKL